MDGENTSSIVLTQSLIDHLNLLYVFLCQIIYKQLQIALIVLGMKQLNVHIMQRIVNLTEFYPAVKLRLDFPLELNVSYHRPPTKLPTLFF